MIRVLVTVVTIFIIVVIITVLFVQMLTKDALDFNLSCSEVFFLQVKDLSALKRIHCIQENNFPEPEAEFFRHLCLAMQF